MDVLKTLSGSWSFNLTDIKKTLRTAFLMTLVVGGIAGVQYIDHQDFGSMDKFVTIIALPILDFLRRWAKNNSIEIPDIKEPSSEGK